MIEVRTRLIVRWLFARDSQNLNMTSSIIRNRVANIKPPARTINTPATLPTCNSTASALDVATTEH